MNRLLVALCGALLFLLALPIEVHAAEEAATEVAATEENDAPEASFFAETTVTALGREVDAFEIATPVTVLQSAELERRAADNAADALRDEAGVDVNGIGPNQERPIIRGLRGLRVLFLENGLRLNNARRQTDFGEITGLVDIDEVETLEVVRGPASVLYGSDAIGGVLNLLTKAPSRQDGRPVGGSLALRYGTAGEQTRASGSIDGHAGRFSYRLGLAVRESDNYESASGSFGRIRLDDEAEVIDSGVKDDNATLFLGFELGENQSLTLRSSRYSADQTGFGFVEPELLGESEDARIRILYPEQTFERFNLGYLGANLGTWLADTVEVQGYHQSNERELANIIDINIGPIFPGAPNSGVHADTLNFTDVDTLGLRTEVIKVAGEKHLFTYGFEASEDDSVNTDSSVTTTTIRFPFPPFQRVTTTRDTIANAPNATNTSYGFFVQDEITVLERLKVTAGARYQRVETQAEPTRGWDISGLDFADSNWVGSISAIVKATDYLNVTGSFGTAFRAPNIIERLFNGPTPEGSGFQILNADLTSESSQNIDLGFKYRRANAFLELTIFRNEVEDGIIQDFLTAAEIAALPADLQARIRASGARFVVQQVNAQKLRYEGAEVALGYRSPRGLALGATVTYLDATRLDSRALPTEDNFGEKVSFYARYEPVAGRYWAEYRARYNGENEANLEPEDPVPAVGRILPSFTIHSVAGGVTLLERGRQQHSLGLVVENLTDELYSEFSNATFFRPQPGRNATLIYRLRL